MINLNEKITSNVLLAANTSSTSTSTGALIVLGGAAIQGNLSIGGNIFLNQELIGGSTSNYSDANVSAFLAAYGSNTVVTTGNITAGNVFGTTFTGNLDGKVRTAIQATITTLGTLTSVNTSGNVNVTNTVNTSKVITTGDVTIGGKTQVAGIVEIITDVTQSANVVILDFATSGIFYRTGNNFQANFVVNITNAPNVDSRMFTVTLFQEQPATLGFFPANLTVNGTAVAIHNIENLAFFPTPGLAGFAGTLNKPTDIFTFTLVKRSGQFRCYATMAPGFNIDAF